MKEYTNIKTLTLSAMMVVLMAICSWISIPAPVPFTMQIFAVFVASGVLGGKMSGLACTAYVILGAIGIPVFSGFSGGIGSIIGPTGGYIVGFILAALISGYIMDIFGRKSIVMVIAMVIGLIACYVFGTCWFVFLYSRENSPISFITGLMWCVVPFIIPDLVKIGLALVTLRVINKSSYFIGLKKI